MAGADDESVEMLDVIFFWWRGGELGQSRAAQQRGGEK